mmetsp:Transcript_7556/g.13281  ORF Transcript_7556/g.13281 Transcript_7556/m.13281 type:complete len:367 (-) Transcript_7556:56-1156(-)
MVQTRKSSRKLRSSQKSEVQEKADEQNLPSAAASAEARKNQDAHEEEEISTKKTPLSSRKSPARTSSSSSSAKKEKKKSRRQQEKEELKSKNTGVGLKIAVDKSGASSNAKKIVFDDDNLPPVETERNEDVSDNENNPATEGKAEEEDDDDAVEEVTGQTAREEAIDQLKSEEKQSLKATKKKKKRKDRKSKGDKLAEKKDDEVELDDEFFSQLETVRQEEAEQRKEAEKAKARAAAKGKHTTFVFSQDDEVQPNFAVKVGGNIEVVVLKDASSSFASDGGVMATPTAISEEALLYSRSRLTDGSDCNDIGSKNTNSGRNSHKRSRGTGETVPWKRARNHATMVNARSNRRNGKGKPAVFFTRKTR